MVFKNEKNNFGLSILKLENNSIRIFYLYRDFDLNKKKWFNSLKNMPINVNKIEKKNFFNFNLC